MQASAWADGLVYAVGTIWPCPKDPVRDSPGKDFIGPLVSKAILISQVAAWV
jgi:hypothetical protein